MKTTEKSNIGQKEGLLHINPSLAPLQPLQVLHPSAFHVMLDFSISFQGIKSPIRPLRQRKSPIPANKPRDVFPQPQDLLSNQVLAPALAMPLSRGCFWPQTTPPEELGLRFLDSPKLSAQKELGRSCPCKEKPQSRGWVSAHSFSLHHFYRELPAQSRGIINGILTGNGSSS